MSSNKKLKSTIVNEDRISGLPDHILHSILRNLESTQAVQTCVLSKRWRDVWKFLSTLTFKYRTYQFSDSENNLDAKMTSFTNYVKHFLSHRDQSTDVFVFHFKSPYSVDRKFLKRLISYAIKHNVKGLSVRSSYSKKAVNAIQKYIEWDNFVAAINPKPIRVAHSLFDCQWLKMLKLDSFNRLIRLPKSLNLPSLENMTLEWFLFSDLNRDIFSSCPNLVCLGIYYCCIANGLEIFSISAPKLKALKILYLHGKKYNIPSLCKVVIDAPNLTFFKFKGLTPMDFVMGKFPSLDEVKIYLQPQLNNNNYTWKFVQLLMRMLAQLCNAKSVELSLITLEVLSRAPDLLEDHHPPFCKLKCLKLIAEEQCKEMTPAIHDVLTYLCKNSPNVEIEMAKDQFGKEA